MNKLVKEVLTDAGWYEGRKIDKDYLIEELKGANIIPNDHIVDLYEQFWNLKIEYENPNGYHVDINLNIEEALYLCSPRKLRELHVKAKEILVPVATACSESFLILIGHSGKFYIYSDELNFLASSFNEAILSLLEQKESFYR